MSLARDLDRFERSPLNHLRLSMLGVVLHALDLLGGNEELVGQHAFIAEYFADFDRLSFASVPPPAAWRSALAQWSAGHDELPLERLKAAGLSELGIDILVTLGFAEDDVRLAGLFGECSRLTLGAVHALCYGSKAEAHPETVASAVASLAAFGLVSIETAGPRNTWPCAIVPAVWDALAGALRMPPGLSVIAVGELPEADAFIPPRTGSPTVEAIVAMLRQRRLVLSLRGPAHNGRHLLAGCVIKALGQPLLTVEAQGLDDPATWSLAGALACITGAAILVELALAPGEDRAIPALPFGEPPLIVIAGASGGIRSIDGRPVVAVDLPAPDFTARAELWRRAVPEPLARDLVHRFRLTSGNIVRAAESASIRAELLAAPAILREHVEDAVRGLHDSRLEAVASCVEPLGPGDFIALDDNALDELGGLAMRCRHRELLNAGAHATAGSAGVRALFAGPSGTGKTLCARWLARQLGKEVYRLDLAASVSKYIGETEKVLDRAFSAAEDLDCILLIDEGDALMARRTDVGSANDRYANLETNFLLQRIESFDGIFVVTTNAAERIDKAFSRRMDVVVHFRLPDEVRRYEILDRHLGEHRASDSLVQEIACRCPLSGGQLRNVAQHARLLTLDGGLVLGDDELRAALAREYRKIDGHCPLKPHLAAAM